VQIGCHHRDTPEIVSVAQGAVPWGVLLISAQYGRLQRGVAGFDQVPRFRWWVGGQPIRYGNHQGIATGTKSHLLGRDIQQHIIADLGRTHQLRIGQRPNLHTLHLRLQFLGTGPSLAQLAHHAAPPPDHGVSIPSG